MFTNIGKEKHSTSRMAAFPSGPRFGVTLLSWPTTQCSWELVLTQGPCLVQILMALPLFSHRARVLRSAMFSPLPNVSASPWSCLQSLSSRAPSAWPPEVSPAKTGDDVWKVCQRPCQECFPFLQTHFQNVCWFCYRKLFTVYTSQETTFSFTPQKTVSSTLLISLQKKSKSSRWLNVWLCIYICMKQLYMFHY